MNSDAGTRHDTTTATTTATMPRDINFPCSCGWHVDIYWACVRVMPNYVHVPARTHSHTRDHYASLNVPHINSPFTSKHKHAHIAIRELSPTTTSIEDDDAGASVYLCCARAERV